MSEDIQEDSQQTESQRKATDVIISVEDKVNMLIKMVSVYDMNIKIILDRTNKIYSYIENLKSEYGEPEEVSQNDKDIALSQSEVIKVSDTPVIEKRSVRTNPEIPQKLNSEDFGSVKKTPVIQRVSDSNGKDVFMAEVSILTPDGELVQKTKTNAMGKWQALLKSGDYIVNISKTDSASKRKIEITQNVNIPAANAGSNITLPVVLMKR
jgi:hypothetical protein